MENPFLQGACAAGFWLILAWYWHSVRKGKWDDRFLAYRKMAGLGFHWWYAGRNGRGEEGKKRFYLEDMRSRASFIFYVFTGALVLALVFKASNWVLFLLK